MGAFTNTPTSLTLGCSRRSAAVISTQTVWGEITRAARVEVETQQIRPGLDGSQRIFQRGDPANLDRSLRQAPHFGRRVRGRHQRLAHQDGVHARLAQPVHIRGGVDAAFGHQHTP